MKMTAMAIAAAGAAAACMAGPAEFVDMRIGTGRSTGSNVLGPCVPHGSAHPSPDSVWPAPHKRPKGARHGFGAPTSGWWPGDKVVGFSQLHAQGTGGVPSYGIFRYLCGQSAMEIVEAHPYRLRVRLVDDKVEVDVSASAHGAIYLARTFDGKPCAFPLDRRCKLAKADCVNEKGEFTGNWNPVPYNCYAYEETDASSGVHRIAVSFASEEKAREYFAAELAGKSVDEIASAAKARWDAVLSRVCIEGVDDAERRRFYSQLAQTFVQPRDRTADGIGWDDHYTLWDTWRTLFPLMAIVDPDSLAANVNSFADRFERSGMCASCYTSGKEFKVAQGGDEADCVIADAWAKKIPGVDWKRVVPLLESRWNGRTRHYREKGYAADGQCDDYTSRNYRACSTTMSFAYQDWCCAEVLEGLGMKDKADMFRARSGNWTNVWDVSSVDEASGVRGFPRARRADGSFKGTKPREGFNTDFYEANCWEYSLFAPHDMDGLVARCGGKDAFRRRVEYALENGIVDFGNEPAFLVPWLFAYADRGDLVVKWAREVGKLFKGDGLPGDNDSGAMSALYVFLKLGFFPVAGQDVYVMHGPAYPKIDISLSNGKTFTVRKLNPDGDTVKSVALNGLPHDPLFLRHSEILAGGELVFTMACAAQQKKPTVVRITPDAASHVYKTGATAVVKISVENPPDNGNAEVWADDGWTNVVWRHTLVFSNETSVAASLTRATPGSLRIHVKGSGFKERMDRIIFGVDEITPFTPRPADFEEYWRGERERLAREVPIAVEKVRARDLDTGDHEMYRVSFATFKGGRVYGILAVPKGEGRSPFVVNVPGAGIGQFRIDKRYLRKGWGTLMMNVHGFPLGKTKKEQQSNYNAWFAEHVTKKGEPRYQYVGYSESREAPFYHAAMLGMARAVEWLAAEPYADSSRVVYYGCSQGGGFGLYLTALYGRFAKSLILCPNKCDMMAYCKGREPGSSHIMNQKPENRAKAERIAPYHDNCNFARMIKTPIRVVQGTADDDCQTLGVIAAYNSIASDDKELRLLPGVGHGSGGKGWRLGGLDKWLFGFAPTAPAPENVPELMKTFGGEKVESLEQWEKVRAPEIVERFRHEVFGVRPKEAEDRSRVSFEVTDTRDAMDGKALRKMVTIKFAGPKSDFSFPVTVFIPKSDKPVPAFVFICNRPRSNIDPDRSIKSDFWPAEEIVARGYATAAFQFGDVAMDDTKAGFGQGVFPSIQDIGERTSDSWAAISAWAWGASRILDWMETEPLIDAKHVGVVGHSRGGKTAIWAGATDKRFAMVCSNNSGCTGARINHINLPKAETIDKICRFTHWFCKNYDKYRGKDKTMDFDQHELLAVIAPRLLCVASATTDNWAGQPGEWWGAKLASPAWELYGKKGLVADAWPKAETPQQDGFISYHMRTGKHDLTPYDWGRYMDFADRHGWR